MRLIGVLLLTGLLASTSAWAGKPWVGFRVAQVEPDFTWLDESSTTGVGMVMGMWYPHWRIYGDLNLQSFDQADTRTIHVNQDFLWSLTERTQLFAGWHLGLADLELASAHGVRYYDSGPGGGVQAGLIYSVSNRWLIEVGARYSRYDVSSDSAVAGQPIDLEALTEVFLVLSYAH